MITWVASNLTKLVIAGAVIMTGAIGIASVVLFGVIGVVAFPIAWCAFMGLPTLIISVMQKQVLELQPMEPEEEHVLHIVNANAFL